VGTERAVGYIATSRVVLRLARLTLDEHVVASNPVVRAEDEKHEAHCRHLAGVDPVEALTAS
jgi:hypothetical protein